MAAERNAVVAVVDDDPRLVESLQDLLESAGYCVRSFSSANELMGHGISEVDVLVTDICMPGIGGFELVEIARRARADLPIFLVSGRHEVLDESRAKGMSGFFRKPFDAQALLTAIGNALDHSRKEDSREV